MIRPPPFPWFGGKSRVAHVVWRWLGDVNHYVEPFAGSLGVLLNRPRGHVGSTSTINDRDAYVANFWRAVSAAPEEVARHANWPVNETDLFSRHLWLVNSGRERLEALEADPEFYDAQVAGWWVWGQCAWIGGGWCSGKGPWHLSKDGGVERIDDVGGTAGQGVKRKRVHLGNAGRGVKRQLVHLGNEGQGVKRKRVHLGDTGRGVNRQRVHLAAGQGVKRPYQDMTAYMYELRDALRHVRVCCGDWSRVVTDGALSIAGTVGVFLDPPYSGEVRRSDIYAVDDYSCSVAVREWALAHENDHRLRIVLAGYEAEHAAHMPPTWRKYSYRSQRAYGNSHRTTANAFNRTQERLWLSPSCVGDEVQSSLGFETASQAEKGGSR